MPRNLYFDIDGTFAFQSDDVTPKPALMEGRLQAAIERARIDRLVCASGHSGQLFLAGAAHLTNDQRKWRIANLLDRIFDPEWLLPRLDLLSNTDDRFRVIDVTSDFLYVDDFAEHFALLHLSLRQFAQLVEWTPFCKDVMREKMASEGLDPAELCANRKFPRIHMSNPDDTGEEILTWLDCVSCSA
ncbi:MAG: hypothetical protein JSS49_28025 [Planctomycetes bacterium]|nr:hypothetical protein [Planctomycetota bacterium]